MAPRPFSFQGRERAGGHRDEDGCPDEPPVGREYFANGLRGVRFGHPDPLPRSGADAPVGYFFSTTDDRTTENYPYVSPDRFFAVAGSPRPRTPTRPRSRCFGASWSAAWRRRRGFGGLPSRPDGVKTMRLPPALWEVTVALHPASSSMLGPTVSFEPMLPW